MDRAVLALVNESLTNGPSLAGMGSDAIAWWFQVHNLREDVAFRMSLRDCLMELSKLSGSYSDQSRLVDTDPDVDVESKHAQLVQELKSLLSESQTSPIHL